MKVLKNIGWFAFFQVIAFLPSLSAVAVKTGGWYAELYKPSWTPPDAVFAPVWTTLYVLIGIAGYVAWVCGPRRGRKEAFTVYAIQLGLNALWSPLFFGMQQVGLALGDLILLWFFILLSIGVFSQRSMLAAWLMVPYFLWVSFAGALNAAILMMN
jgi:tryptophan-rich sensory protein